MNRSVVSPSRRLLVSAFGINSGGGLVLLNALAGGLNGCLKTILLDARLVGRAPPLDPEAAIRYVRRSFAARMTSLNELASAAATDDVLLCFNSLPPLRRSKARVVAYVQAPHFAGAHRGISYTPLTTLRIFIERVWFRRAVRNCDEIWVQTRTMADAMRAQYPGKAVTVVPLLDEQLSCTLAAVPTSRGTEAVDWSQVTFFYPADAVGHKNHGNLLRAWSLLAAADRAPKLHLTLEPRELHSLLREAGLDASRLTHVTAFGRLPREAVMQRLAASSALIFPSMAETFGLPMLEATALRIPILAAERDFVRDVCAPAQTFDPTSPRSIAMAVQRFVDGTAEERPRYVSALEFVERLLS